MGEKIAIHTRGALGAGDSVLGLRGSVMPWLDKVMIAAPASSAVGDQDALAGRSEIGDGSALIVENQRTDGNLQNHVRPGMARAVGAFTVAAAIGFEFPILPVAE